MLLDINGNYYKNVKYIENRTDYFFTDMTNIKNFDLNLLKIEKIDIINISLLKILIMKIFFILFSIK